MIVEVLKVFVTVAEQRNFSRAAELLNLSQPGVSQQIRNLENELGAKLLHRSPKQVKLTVAGEVLYKRAKQILIHYEEAKQEIHLLQNIVTGSLKIGASLTIGEYLLPRLLVEFTTKYPQVDIQVLIRNTEEIVQLVHSNEFDLGLVEGLVSQNDVDVKPFIKDKMILVAPNSHPLSSLRKIEVDMLHNQVWILREFGSGTRAFSDQFIDENNLAVKRSFIFNSSQGVKEAVSAGLGLAILSQWVVRKELNKGEICELPIEEQAFIRDFSLIHPRNNSANMALRMFEQLLFSLYSGG
jgi:LysR family transcriptional regulator, transcriptional activator of the cysJI operon